MALVGTAPKPEEVGLSSERLRRVHEHDLVVLGGVLRDERHLAHPRHRLAAVGDHEAEHLGVEREHSIEIADGERGVGEAQAG